MPLSPVILKALSKLPRSLPSRHRWKSVILCLGMTLLAADCPAPDLRLPALPNLFKRSGAALQETNKAPYAPGGLCILPSGEYVISCHQFFQPSTRVMIYGKDNRWEPFPNAEMNDPQSSADIVLDSVLGIACDPRGIVWMLDNGRRSDSPPKLVAWDTKADSLHQVIFINKQTLTQHSFLRHLVLDPSTPHIYISDPGDGVSAGIIVVDTRTGLSRRVLDSHHSVQHDPSLNFELEGKPVVVYRPDGQVATPLSGVSAMAVDRKGDWLYYGARNSTTLYKIRTDLLKRTDLAEGSLVSQVTGVSTKPICESIVLDAKGRIYFADTPRGSIDYVTPDEQFLNLRLLIEDPRIIWPSGLIIGPDGNIHFFSNQLHRSPFFNTGKDISAPPFSIFKTQPVPSSRFGF